MVIRNMTTEEGKEDKIRSWSLSAFGAKPTNRQTQITNMQMDSSRCGTKAQQITWWYIAWLGDLVIYCSAEAISEAFATESLFNSICTQ